MGGWKASGILLVLAAVFVGGCLQNAAEVGDAVEVGDAEEATVANDNKESREESRPTSAPDPAPPPGAMPPESSDAHADAGATESIPGSMAWQADCGAAWTSEHDYDAPPWVGGVPCLFRVTNAGTIHWLWTPPNGSVLAAPLPREDGLMDWVTWSPETGAVELASFAGGRTKIGTVNATGEPEYTTLSAAWLGSALHIFWGSDFVDQGATHAWWTPENGLLEESLESSWGFGDPARLRSDGTTLVVQASRLDISYIYTSEGGPFTAHPFPGSLFSVDVHDGEIWGCLGLAETYHAVHGTRDEDRWIFTTEVVAPGLFADLAFTCTTAVLDGVPSVAYDIPVAIGGGPHPAGGTHVATRADGVWPSQYLGAAYHSGADMAAAGGWLVHMMETGNGTGTGGEQYGTELRGRQGEGPAAMPLLWGNFGRTSWFVDDDDRVLVVGEMWANSPFHYYGDGGESLSWAVVEPRLLE